MRHAARGLAIGLMIVVAPMSAQAAGFVDTNGRQLVVNGQPFYVHGANQYLLPFAPPALIDEILTDASSLGLNAIRTWAFCNGAGENGFCFQPQPGVYHEASFRQLDYVLYRAGQLNLRVILPLVNNWDDFGGMNQYLAWCGSTAGHDAFYTNSCAKTAYQQYVQYVLNRVNTYTGVAYKNDPTILLWELANEPQCMSDPSGNTVLAWVDEMAAFIKSLDANHLVGTGEEGWYTSKGTDWRHNGTKGVDFLRNSRSASIDVASFHVYPAGYAMSEAEALAWIDEHVDDAHLAIGKPVVLGEFGWLVPRKVFGVFSTGTDGWTNDWGFSSSSPQRVESPSQDANGAVVFTPAGSIPANGSAAAQRLFADPGFDARAYQEVAAWVYLPPTAPGDVRAVLYTKSGSQWTWREGSVTGLVPGSWTRVAIATPLIDDPASLRGVGVKIFGGATPYTGGVYVDAVTASTSAPGQTMADRERIYAAWYDRLNAKDADAAVVWLLAGHEPDTSVTPDHDHFSVYYPEDAGVSDAIAAYSAVIAGKNIAPPAAPRLGVKSITLALTRKGRQGIKKQAFAAIAVVDQLGRPVSGVTVSTRWSGASSDTDITTTDSAGVAKNIASNEVHAAAGFFRITVEQLTKAGFSYDPSLNLETSDQIAF